MATVDIIGLMIHEVISLCSRVYIVDVFDRDDLSRLRT